ncbi:glycosyltransferase family 39 protein [Patescibacteria group bacterium]|nr:glycosyltransferase family 39 protein [Patescibacteria group bacterium]
MSKIKSLLILLRGKEIYIIISLLFLLPRTTSLKYDMSNSDAARWHRRSIGFLESLKSGDFKETYQSYHPGVTIMWIGAISEEILFRYQLIRNMEPKTLENADFYPVIHLITRLFVILSLLALVTIQYELIGRLFSVKTALIYVMLISIEPYYIGINRWFHLTSLEINLMFTSLLFVMYWSKCYDQRALNLSAVLLALALLTKISAVIVIPAIFLVLLLKFKEHRNVLILISFPLLVILTFYLFFPAMWTDSFYVFSNIFRGITGSINGEIRKSDYSGITSFLYYPAVFLYKYSFVTVTLFLVSLWEIRKTKDFNILIVLANILLSFLFLTITSQKIDRYSIVFLPSIILTISICFTNYLMKPGLPVFLSMMVFLIAVEKYHPVYSAYYSGVLGGTKTALENGFYDNSGEYFANAAIYLNGKGRDITVYVPNNIESFSYYFKGNIKRDFDGDVDYVVYSMDTDRKRLNYFPGCEVVEEEFGPKDFSTVFVLKCPGE